MKETDIVPACRSLSVLRGEKKKLGSIRARDFLGTPSLIGLLSPNPEVRPVTRATPAMERRPIDPIGRRLCLASSRMYKQKPRGFWAQGSLDSLQKDAVTNGNSLP
jgi:hypothetical protein